MKQGKAISDAGEGNFAGRVESKLCIAIKPCGYLEGNNISFKQRE